MRKYSTVRASANELGGMMQTSYRDRGGKYQGQQGVTLPKI